MSQTYGGTYSIKLGEFKYTEQNFVTALFLQKV